MPSRRRGRPSCCQLRLGQGPEFAARGYRYVLQACRGTDGSGGTHSYFAEAGDGRATADWIASQPWFNGRMGTFGGSYMGFTQWALASTKPPHLKAMAVALSTSVRAYSWYPGGSLALEVIIPWDAGATQFNQQANAVPTDISPEGIERRMAELKAGFDHLPLGEVIHRLTAVDLQLYRDQLAHGGAGDAFWEPVNFRPLLAEWTVPTLLVDGWHDYPLPGVVEDYAVLRSSPAPVHLRIGAGGHLGGGGEGGMTDAPLDWFDTWLLAREGLLGPTPVRVHVQGEGGHWRDLSDWPPPSKPTRWYLHAGGHLAPMPPEAPSEPDRYRYDPADPTPSMGGIGMLTGGTVDNRPLEARPDVLVYTSDELGEPLELGRSGPPRPSSWLPRAHRRSPAARVPFTTASHGAWEDADHGVGVKTGARKPVARRLASSKDPRRRALSLKRPRPGGRNRGDSIVRNYRASAATMTGVFTLAAAGGPRLRYDSVLGALVAEYDLGGELHYHRLNLV